jgi:predicted aconitase with swiveling domain
MSEPTPRKIVLKGRKIVGGVAEGEALVSSRPMMGWGMVNDKEGFTTEEGHPLFEVPFKGKVLVMPGMRGSGGFVMYGHTRAQNVHPAAFVFGRVNSVMIFAGMGAQVPTVTDFDKDPVEVIATGDWVKVDGDNGIVEVTKRGYPGPHD